MSFGGKEILAGGAGIAIAIGAIDYAAHQITNPAKDALHEVQKVIPKPYTDVQVESALEHANPTDKLIFAEASGVTSVNLHVRLGSENKVEDKLLSFIGPLTVRKASSSRIGHLQAGVNPGGISYGHYDLPRAKGDLKYGITMTIDTKKLFVQNADPDNVRDKNGKIKADGSAGPLVEAKRIFLGGSSAEMDAEAGVLGDRVQTTICGPSLKTLMPVSLQGHAQNAFKAQANAPEHIPGATAARAAKLYRDLAKAPIRLIFKDGSFEEKHGRAGPEIPFENVQLLVPPAPTAESIADALGQGTSHGVEFKSAIGKCVIKPTAQADFNKATGNPGTTPGV
jgi:hypothetical protein